MLRTLAVSGRLLSDRCCELQLGKVVTSVCQIISASSIAAEDTPRVVQEAFRNPGSLRFSQPRGLQAFALRSLSTTVTESTSSEAEDREAIDQLRNESNFKRAYSGIVHAKRNWSDEWLEVKLDAEVPGAMLFRGTDGTVYYLVSGALKQIDLSNDMLVARLFANDAWEKALQPLLIKSDGVDHGVRITQENFRKTTSMMKAVSEHGIEPGPDTQP